MHIAKKYLPIVILTASLAVSAMLVALRRPPQTQTIVAKPVAVHSIAVQRRDTHLWVHSQGTVVPYTQTTLVSEVAGKVLHLSPRFVTGGLFHQGEELIRIDPSDYQVSVTAAEAALAGAQARLAQETARAQQARKDWNSIGKGQPSDLVLRKPYVAEARAKVRSAAADLQRAQRELSRTHVRAPYDGLVRKKLADVGQYVTPGSRLGVIFATDHAEVRLPLSQEDRRFVQLPDAPGAAGGSPVVLRTRIGGELAEFPARLVRDEGVVDEKSRLTHVVARIDDPYRRASARTVKPGPKLQSGTFVEAEIQGIRLHDIAIIPRQAVHGGNRLYTLDSGNHLHIRTVDILRADTDTVYVRQGLVAGERVIVSAIGSPLEGMRVRDDAVAGPTTSDHDSGLSGGD